MLVQYREARDHPRTLGHILKPALPRLLILIVLVTAGAFTFPAWLACLVEGFAVGGVVRHVSMAVQARRVLPVFLKVIDWAKVDQLLGDSDVEGSAH
jgi:hypothetical protein